MAAIVYFMLGRRSAARDPGAGRCAALALPVPLVAASPGTSHVVGVATVWLFFFAAPFVAGRWVGRGTLLASELRETSTSSPAGSARGQSRAASEERARIARELHDVVAHNVSVMVVQTQAARRVAAGDLAAAGTRTAVGLGLRSRCPRRHAANDRRAAPRRSRARRSRAGAATDPGRARRGIGASGLTGGVRHRAPLPAPIDLASYRLVQEALTNVIKHAGAASCRDQGRLLGRARLSSTSRMTARAEGPRPTSEHAGGHGLIGMRERLALYGGEMHAGERLDGGFQIRAWIPIDEDRQS